ncbi:hypothetical protein QP027_00170 [Corynebacterium breve]|uniref:Serine hydrolase n=1 Tax=Corynebacterium breve TaxID=3049799 RepID=A0ABY8VEC1_9CORY|nr:hypothetical protein [Corynebacterium breve]WIM67858.1 hypothetical protein QP027_00170 [Corynebacterium breve]
MKKFLGLVLALIIAVGLAPAASAVSLTNSDVNSRSSLAVVYSDGSSSATANGYEARPALSLSKLYLGYWVMYHGSEQHKSQVEYMLRVSHDGLASEMDAAYPQAIDEIARDFNLSSTSRNGYWGQSSTSAVDVARFVQSIRPDPAAAPVLRGMTTAAPVANDGIGQNFGTSRLPGAWGTKYGWSNDLHSSTATVSFGDGWAAATMTYGDTQANTHDTLHGFGMAPAVGPLPVPAPELPEIGSTIPELEVPEELTDVLNSTTGF